jgi:hypothetical protein
MRLDILILINTAPDHSLAMAFASIVFPVPGGPYNKTPFCGPRSFPCENKLGRLSGRIVSSTKACLILSNPPMESNSTFISLGLIISQAITSYTQIKHHMDGL